MAKENLTPEILLEYEDLLHEVAARLRKIRELLGESGESSFSANVGTLRHSIKACDEYSLKLLHEYESVELKRKRTSQVKGEQKAIRRELSRQKK